MKTACEESMGVGCEAIMQRWVYYQILSVCAYPSRPVHSRCTVYVQHVERPPSLQYLSVIYTPSTHSASQAGSRHNRLATPARPPARLPGKYRCVQPPVASISAGQNRSLRPENCLAVSISISSTVDYTTVPPPTSSTSQLIVTSYLSLCSSVL